MELLGFDVPIWSILLSMVAVGLVILYRRLTKDFGYWKSQGVVTEKPRLLVGTEYDIFKKPLHEVDVAKHKKFGRIYGMYFNGTKILSIAEPEIIKNILVKDFPIFINRQKVSTGIKLMDKGLTVLPNEDWKRVRSVISPTFTTGKIRKMAIMVRDHAEKLTKNFLDAASKGEIVESKKFFAAFTMDVIGSCAFGVEVDSLRNPEHPFVVNSAKMFNRGVSVLTLILFFFPFLMKLLGSYIFKAIGFQYFADVATNMLKLRKSDPNQKRVDFLQLMLDAQEGKLEKTEEENPEIDSHYTQTPVENKPWVSTKTISEDEILSQCVIFLLAGHETTATTINYIIYNLAMNPDVQEKLLQEVDEAWQKNGDMDYDAANKMTYLTAVVSETLRTHVIAPRVMREASEDYTIELPNKTIVVPKGGQISIPVYAMHHDADFFPDPERFDPDRFLPENKDLIQPYTYLPFGDGPRNCVGMRFALMNIKLCMAHLLRQVKFVATEETKKPLEFIVGQGILQAKNLVVKPEKRIKS